MSDKKKNHFAVLYRPTINGGFGIADTFVIKHQTVPNTEKNALAYALQQMQNREFTWAQVVTLGKELKEVTSRKVVVS